MNAKSEFLSHIGSRQVICATVNDFHLTTGWTPEDWNQFLDNINFDYDNGYGGQELFGVIWYSDGTWSNRGEYDGSEWWNFNQCPQIPEYLIRTDKVRDQKLNLILYGGGYWTCSRCGTLMRGSSIHHCDPLWHQNRF